MSLQLVLLTLVSIKKYDPGIPFMLQNCFSWSGPYFPIIDFKHLIPDAQDKIITQIFSALFSMSRWLAKRVWKACSRWIMAVSF